MFSVPVPPARALVPPRMTLALSMVLLMLMTAPFCIVSSPLAPSPRPTRTPAPCGAPLKKMTPSRFTVEWSMVAAPVPPLSATAKRDATIVAPFVIVSTPDPVAVLLTVKSRSPLPSTETVAPSLMVICASPPLPTMDVRRRSAAASR